MSRAASEGPESLLLPGRAMSHWHPSTSIPISQAPAPAVPSSRWLPGGLGRQPLVSSSVGLPATSTAARGAAEDPPGSSTASHSDHPFPQQSHPAQSWRPRMKPSQLCASAASPSDSAVVQELEQIPRTLSQIFISQPLFCVALLCFLSLSWLSLQSKQALQLLSKCWSHLTFPPQEPGVCLQHSDGACNDALRQQPQAQPHTQHWRVML